MKKPEKKITVACPACGKEVIWSTDNPSRPFCSERCKLLDLGDWASEKHRVPGEPANPSDGANNHPEGQEDKEE